MTKVSDILSKVKFPDDVDQNCIEIIENGGTVYTDVLHKPYELCRFLNREVLDVKKERYRDPVFSAFKVRIALK